MIKEFKEFIMRGNVLDLAVGVVMGAAFTAIVTALVEHIITPVIVAITGNANVSALTIQIGEAKIEYGFFIQAIIDFLLIALILFLVIKGINKLAHKKEEPEPEPEAPTAEQYLAEIRDLLAAQQGVETNHSPNDHER
ncbi:large-conductance mechanosensitive channel protein MscL [Amphibacillus sp. Q70]|uniref:large-conductance mechanosensitive channel protein MscL n=1 Tax=Amphibacillus sp. Q70 TaxID=3453416 RepID=UPI003F86452A